MILIAKRSGRVRFGGVPRTIRRGVTTADSGADIARTHPHLWTPLRIDYPAPVEVEPRWAEAGDYCFAEHPDPHSIGMSGARCGLLADHHGDHAVDVPATWPRADATGDGDQADGGTWYLVDDDTQTQANAEEPPAETVQPPRKSTRTKAAKDATDATA